MTQLFRKNMLPVLLLAFAFAATACGKGGGSAAAGETTGYFPKDTSAVIGLNFDAIRSSKIYKEFEPQIKAAMEKDEKFTKIKTVCGVDFTTEVKSAMIGLGKDPQDDKGTYIAISGVGKDKVNKCITDMKAKGEKVDFKEEAPLTSYTVDGETIWVWWASADTVVTSPSADKDSAPLKALAAGGPKMSDNAALMANVKRTDSGAMLWMAGAIPADQNTDMAFAQLGGKPNNLSMSVNVPSGLDAKVVLEFADEATAKKANDQVKVTLEQAKGQPMVGAYLTGVKHEQAGKDVTVTVELSESDVNQLMSMVKMALGSMMQ